MEIIRNMFRRKMRTFLTVFGIVIGVFALVVMGAMAEKINLLIKGGESYLVNSIAISPKGSANSFSSMVAFPDTYGNEVKKIKGVRAVTNSATLLYDDELSGVNMGVPKMVMGVNANEQKQAEKYYDPSLQVGFAQGGYWQEGQRNKAVLGVDIARELKAKLGGTVENRGMKFEVVGILNRTMTAPDNIMMVPIDDARELYKKTQPVFQKMQDNNFVTSTMAIAKASEAEEVANRIKEAHPDWKVVSPKENIKSLTKNTDVFNMVVIGSALIALLVGGLSVINTMLMSVSERTREIGVKKAVGAENRHILMEYIIESSFIGVFSGLLGLGLGAAIVGLINSATAKTGTTIFTITPRLAIGSVLFAIFIGIIAGLYPAYRAAKLDPILALKNE